MAQNKQTRKELMEIEVRINELDRAFPYMKGDFYYERKKGLIERKEIIEEKLERGDIAPDIQYLITEVSED